MLSKNYKVSSDFYIKFAVNDLLKKVQNPRFYQVQK